MVPESFFRRIVALRSEIGSGPALVFSEWLTEARIERLLAQLGTVYRDRIYPPWVTLWMFLGQVLSGDHSCRDAVARWLAFRAAIGLPHCSSNTGPYCAARGRLREELLSQLMRDTGQELQSQTPEAWLFQGRHVKVVDGSTVSMPDTLENEEAFGKGRNQHGRNGFPLARIVVLLCLATGAALELAIGPYRGKKTSELALFRSLQPTLKPGDLLLGDRLFGTYCDIARLRQAGVDVLFRQHAHRKSDFRRGRKLGPQDHVICWRKPSRAPDWLSPEEFAVVPDELEIRELRVQIAVPGFRVRSLVVITTLLDPEQFSKDDLAGLFRQRWHAELDLRSLKTVMQMDVLRCLTPEMVRKEIWTHLLGYNLLRSMMCATALEQGLLVRELSFKGALQQFNAFYLLLVTATAEELADLCDRLLDALSKHRVGNRPDRFEPRKRKRAAKPYPPLKGPRNEERNRCR